MRSCEIDSNDGLVVDDNMTRVTLEEIGAHVYRMQFEEFAGSDEDTRTTGNHVRESLHSPQQARVAMRHLGARGAYCIFPEYDVDSQQFAAAVGMHKATTLTTFLDTLPNGSASYRADGVDITDSPPDANLRPLLKRTADQSADNLRLDRLFPTDFWITELLERHSTTHRRAVTARTNSAELGCAIVTVHPPSDTIELSYLGLVPHARGKGYAQQLYCAARRAAIGLGGQRMTTTADVANQSAMKLYRRLDLIELSRYSLWLCDFSE
ncbi:MAG: GNAT family N-acetyltransferase [Pirellulaceae bacterium]